MNTNIEQEKYFTNDHEWILFNGANAHIGVSQFKLTGFKQIQEINLKNSIGVKKMGDVLGSIKYNDYTIEIHMPVDGKVLEINEKMISCNPNILLDNSESTSWIALITPEFPDNRSDLLSDEIYKSKTNILLK